MDYYTQNPQAYKKFLEYGAEKEEETKYLEKAIPSHLKSRLDKLESEGWNVLDIGCGEGSLTIWLIQYLRSIGPVRCTALDPAANQLQELAEAAERIAFQDITCLPLKWEEYRLEQEHDFVICSHAFYYVKDWETGIQKILDALTEGGKAMISMQAPDNLSYRMGEKFRDRLNPEGRYLLTSASDLSRFLSDQAIPHTVDKGFYPLDLREAKKLSPSGIKLLEFYLADLWEDVPETMREEVVAYIRSLPDVLENEVGHIWFTRH